MIPCIAHLQPQHFHHITTDDGLSQNSVISITQDEFGFLYFATQDGLNRYDGSSMTQYDAYFRDRTRSGFSQLGKVFIDKHNTKWIASEDGTLQYWDSAQDSFVLISGISEVSCIIEKDDTSYYVGSFTDGLYELSMCSPSDYHVEALASGFGIYNIIKEDEGIMLLATTDGVMNFDDNISKKFSSLNGIHVSDIIKEEGRTWIATYGHGLYYANDQDSLRKYTELPADLNIQSIHRDRKSRLWIASYNDGLFLIENGKRYNFLHDPLDEKSINYNDVLSIFEDRQGNIWFGTDGGGVSFIKNDPKPIYGVTNAKLNFQAFVNVPRAISTDEKGTIWIGTSGKGLTSVTPDLSHTSYYSTSADDPFKISSDRIMSLYHDHAGQLWIGTQEGGLLYKAKNQDRIQVVSPEEFQGVTIWDIKQADQDHLWLCTRDRGLILFDIINISATYYNSKSGDLNDDNISVMCQGRTNDEFIIGSDDGSITVIDYADMSFRKLSISQELRSVKSLYLQNDELWIGTSQNGIIVHDLKTSESHSISKSNGLPNHMIYAILPHNDEYLWISTNKGIAQIYQDYSKPNVLNQLYSISDGIVSDEFNTGAYHVDDRGILYFGGIDGVNWFDPDKLIKDRRPIDLSLLEVIVTHTSGQIHIPIYNKDQIDLSYKDRDFQLKYSMLDFINTEDREYIYKLEGLNEDWINNGANELVNFSNVPPGEYQFSLKSKNRDGVWNEYSTQIDIHIKPAFWQTIWFRVLVIAALIYSIWKIYKVRLSQIKFRSDLKSQLAKSEAKALKSQMNPHFLFNSLNAIDHYILNNDRATASDYLSKFSKLIRKILDFSNMPLISLNEEIEALKLYLKMEQLRFPEKFNYRINIDSRLNTTCMKIPPLILQPFVENAIWHGLLFMDEPGLLSIDVKGQDDKIICTIDDNGIGRKKSEQIRTSTSTKRKSHGITITEERLRLNNQLYNLGGEISIKDKYDMDDKATGTKVIIKIPYSYSTN